MTLLRTSIPTHSGPPRNQSGRTCQMHDAVYAEAGEWQNADVHMHAHEKFADVRSHRSHRVEYMLLAVT